MPILKLQTTMYILLLCLGFNIYSRSGDLELVPITYVPLLTADVPINYKMTFTQKLHI